MNYKDFANILDASIFHQPRKILIEKIANFPERYIGLFRPTKIETKIIQNLTQSDGIKFGNAFESIIEKYLSQEQYEILDKNISFHGKNFKLDQIAKKDNTIIFVEQKIRDDHDSSKKRGQLDNFKEKIKCLKNQSKTQELIGFFYFLDPALTKNKRFYTKELGKLSNEYKVEIHLVYGGEFFDKLGLNRVWTEIEQYLKKWKKSLPKLLNTNFDSNAESSFKEIKDIKKSIFKKFFLNKYIVQEIWPILFPKGEVLKLLKEHFKTKERPDYKDFIKVIDNYLQKNV